MPVLTILNKFSIISLKYNKDRLIITEAMKMETTVQAPFDEVIKDIYVKDNDRISVNDLLIEFE